MQRDKKWTFADILKMKHSRYGFWAVILVICLMILIVGGSFAKYITSNKRQAEMESAQFHISSNYLKEVKEGATASYNVVDWGSGFDILLYNYETENIAQISQVDMRYTVTATNATVSVNTQLGSPAETDNDEYLFGKSNMTEYHTLHVVPDSNVNKNDTISVTVQTTFPYEKTMKAEFIIQNMYKPDYTIEDQGDGTVLLTIHTNDYQDVVTVTWNPSKYSPDNTNALMNSWKDSSPSGNFPVGSNATYQLLFFKNTDEQYLRIEDTGTEIVLD